MNWFWGKKKEEEIPEDQLKKQGFDPINMPIEKAPDDQLITDINAAYKGFIQPSPQQLQVISQNYKQTIFIRCYPIEGQDRHQLAYQKGGKICGDPRQVTKIRSIAKEVLKQIGRKILNGEFNLTKLSFPIKAMFPKTALQSTIITSYLFPILVVKASKLQDQYERFKIAVSAMLGYMYYANLFLKPVSHLYQLNPILGQTLQAKYPDGTQIYCQQISHHPPISYFLIIGPQKLYKMWGYYHFQASAGLNSLTVILFHQLINKGKRYLQFHDGQLIQTTFPDTVFTGSFLGTLREEAYGSVEFVDKKNDIQCKVMFGNLKKKQIIIIRPSDCFQSTIFVNKKSKSIMRGSVIGYIDIDDNRYFDGRFILPIKPIILDSVLQSDHSRRNDLTALESGKVRQAQVQKQRLQQIQRNDAKLRKNNK